MNHAKDYVSKNGRFPLGAVAAPLNREGSCFGKAEEGCVTKGPLDQREEKREKRCATSSKPVQQFSILLRLIFSREESN